MKDSKQVAEKHVLEELRKRQSRPEMVFFMWRVENGFLLRGIELAEDFVKSLNVDLVYQETYEDDSMGCVRHWADFLRSLDEQFGPMTGRYDPARVKIIIEPGDKHSLEHVDIDKMTEAEQVLRHAVAMLNLYHIDPEQYPYRSIGEPSVLAVGEPEPDKEVLVSWSVTFTDRDEYVSVEVSEIYYNRTRDFLDPTSGKVTALCYGNARARDESGS